MNIIISLILLLLALSMFLVSKKVKLAILIIAGVNFTAMSATFSPFLQNPIYLLPFLFLLSEIKNVRTHIRNISKSALKSIIAVAFIATLILIFHSPHIQSIGETASCLINELVVKYFLICYAFLCIRNRQDLKYIYKMVYISAIVLFVFGLINLATHQANFINIVSDSDAGMRFADEASRGWRFRVQAMFINPFDYGFTCIILMLFYYYGFKIGYIIKKQFVIIIVTSLFGIVSCNCRTVLFVSIVAICVGLLFSASQIRKNLIYILSIGIGGCLILLFTGSISIIDSMMSMFDSNSDVSGSSLEMRSVQLVTVFYYIQNNYWFGRGYRFFDIDMGWGDQEIGGNVDTDLQGIESIVFSYLLERGIIGLLCWCLIIALLIKFAIQNIKHDRMVCSLMLSVISLYTFFALMTGELGSYYLSFIILGIFIKLIYLTPKRKAY